MNRQNREKAIEAENLDEFRLFTWRKSWVRPYESLYSVYRTFTRVNVLSDTRALEILTKGKVKMAVSSEHLYEMLAHTCVPSDTNNHFNTYHICRVLPNILASPKQEVNKFPLFRNKEARDICIATKIRYCPECLKRGYHSWLFQYIAMRKCPIHRIDLIETYQFTDEPKNIMDCHPAIQTINTEYMSNVYLQIFGGIKEIQAFKMNGLFDITQVIGNESGKSLYDVGKEIYVGEKNAKYNVKENMVELLKRLIFQLGDEYASLKRYKNAEYPIENIIDYAFKDWKYKNGAKLNPMLSNTSAVALQVYISMMDNILKSQNSMVYDKDLMYKYMQQVKSISDPLNFYTFYHPYAGELWMHPKTPAFVDPLIMDVQIIPKSTLNENYILFYCIDDHIKFQWENFKRLANEYNNNDIFLIGRKLPRVCYLILTDEYDRQHAIRCTTKN